MTKITPRVRYSLESLQTEYQTGSRKPLEDLMRAWQGIKALPPQDPHSFFTLAGYHGEPFRGAGWGNAAYWGGYCNHGNVLFPTWHRVYLLKLEDALRSIPGCEDVSLPFWDETSDESLSQGLPWALTAETFELDGQTIPNPLRSFVFSAPIVDHLSPFPDTNYSKPKNYETVRYPLSGLVGDDAAKTATAAHNSLFPDPEVRVTLLNQNIVNWLTSTVVINGEASQKTGVKQQFEDCLSAPNYTVFSNTTSAGAWNDQAPVNVTPLESPHNSIHLAIGGFDLPGGNSANPDFSPIPGANGDMGENDTAAFDPVFYFHHCFIDRVFWLWQQRHGATETLEIIPGYPGTNSVDNQGPTPGVAPNSWLNLDSPLDPFVLEAGEQPRPYTSRDCVNIETQLGYTYGPGSLEDQLTLMAPVPEVAPRVVQVSGINRARVRGSFLISAFAIIDGKRQHVGTEAVLSRWHVEGCANCQTHLQAKASFALHGALAAAEPGQLEVEVRTRDGFLGNGAVNLAAPVAEGKPLFKVELR